VIVPAEMWSGFEELVFEALRSLYHSTLGSRKMKKKEMIIPARRV
jgi:hypothetical protein